LNRHRDPNEDLEQMVILTSRFVFLLISIRQEKISVSYYLTASAVDPETVARAEKLSGVKVIPLFSGFCMVS